MRKIVHFKGLIVHFWVPMILQIFVSNRWLNIWLRVFYIKSLWIHTYPTCYDTVKSLSAMNVIACSALVFTSDVCYVLYSDLRHDSLPTFLSYTTSWVDVPVKDEGANKTQTYVFSQCNYCVLTVIALTWTSSQSISPLLNLNTSQLWKIRFYTCSITGYQPSVLHTNSEVVSAKQSVVFIAA